MSETTTVEFEVLAVEPVTGCGSVKALAHVDVMIDGIVITVQGIRVRKRGRTWLCELPTFRRGAEILPAVALPDELAHAIGLAVLGEMGVA